MPVAELDGGLALHYIDRGDGEPLLLIAGIPAIADDWDALACSPMTRPAVSARSSRRRS